MFISMLHTRILLIALFCTNPGTDFFTGQRWTAETGTATKSTVCRMDGYGHGRGEDHVAWDRQSLSCSISDFILRVRPSVLAHTIDEVILGFGEFQKP